MILTLHNTLSFAEIAKQLPNRDEFLVRDRFWHLSGFRYTRPKNKNGRKSPGQGRSRGSKKGSKKIRWTDQEDTILRQNQHLVEGGDASWPELSALLPGRTQSAITQRVRILKLKGRLYKNPKSSKKLSPVKEDDDEDVDSDEEQEEIIDLDINDDKKKSPVKNDVEEDKKKSPFKDDVEKDKNMSPVKFTLRAEAPPFIPKDYGTKMDASAAVQKVEAALAKSLDAGVAAPTYADVAAGVSSSRPKQNWVPTLLATNAAASGVKPRVGMQDSIDDYDI